VDGVEGDNSSSSGSSKFGPDKINTPLSTPVRRQSKQGRKLKSRGRQAQLSAGTASASSSSLGSTSIAEGSSSPDQQKNDAEAGQFQLLQQAGVDTGIVTFIEDMGYQRQLILQCIAYMLQRGEKVTLQSAVNCILLHSSALLDKHPEASDNRNQIHQSAKNFDSSSPLGLSHNPHSSTPSGTPDGSTEPAEPDCSRAQSGPQNLSAVAGEATVEDDSADPEPAISTAVGASFEKLKEEYLRLMALKRTQQQRIFLLERQLAESQRGATEMAEQIHMLTGGFGFETYYRIHHQQQQHEEEELSQLCVVCLERPPSFSCEPCGHRVMCKSCYKKLTVKQCPSCMLPIK